MITINNKLFLTPYKGEKKIKANVSSGFASIKQKDMLVGLNTVCDCYVSVAGSPMTISKGSVVYFPEELLHISPWSTKTYECASIDGKFIIVDVGYAMGLESE